MKETASVEFKLYSVNCCCCISRYTCECVAGYEGANCERETIECNSNPCQHGGRCIDGLNNYTCMCQPGYAGQWLFCFVLLFRLFEPCVNPRRCKIGFYWFRFVLA